MQLWSGCKSKLERTRALCCAANGFINEFQIDILKYFCFIYPVIIRRQPRVTPKTRPRRQLLPSFLLTAAIPKPGRRAGVWSANQRPVWLAVTNQRPGLCAVVHLVSSDQLARPFCVDNWLMGDTQPDDNVDTSPINTERTYIQRSNALFSNVRRLCNADQSSNNPGLGCWLFLIFVLFSCNSL